MSIALVTSPHVFSKNFCKNPLKRSSSPTGANITIVIIRIIIEIGFSGVSKASNCRKDSGAGIIFSIKIFISSEITIAPNDKINTADAVFFEIIFIRSESRIGAPFLFK